MDQIRISAKINSNTWVLVILVFFCFASVFIALRLNTSIAPDEHNHFLFVKEYATTLGKPLDSESTLKTGWYIKDNPYLYYWISARVYKVMHWIKPNLTDWQALQGLRMLSVIYSTLSMWFLFKTSKLLIENKWLQLLPVFLLSNTLMFVFLSGAVSYDPMAIMFCFLAAYFLIRALKQINFWRSSILFLLMVGLGSLVKYPITPFAFVTVISWLVFISIKRAQLPKLQLKENLILISLVAIVLFANVFLYGHNLIVYRDLTPDCNELFTKTQCELSPFHQRAIRFADPQSPNLYESIKQGGPTPLAYFFDSWNYLILKSIYGILAHQYYVPKHIISFFQAFYLLLFLLAARHIKKLRDFWPYIITITMFYTAVVFITNIKTELNFNYAHFSIQGRYLFPVIGFVYLIISWVIENISNSRSQLIIAFITTMLFFYSGPIKFFLIWNGFFEHWFIP